MPLGGLEETAGYKGYGLGMVVEIFTSIFGGSNFGLNVPPWRKGRRGRPANLGQCYFAINPACFADGFNPRLKAYLDQLHSLPSVEKEKTVLVPGDPEREIKKKYESDGIQIHSNLLKSLTDISHQLKVPFFNFK